MKFRHHFLIILAFFGLFTTTSGQIIGDYRTNGAGTSWSTAANWDRWSGVAWVAGASYPGQNATILLTTVTIRDGHNMILDVNVTGANSLVNLVIGGGVSGSLTIGNNGTGRTLSTTALGSVTINAGASLLSGTGGGSHTLSFQSLSNSGTINFSNDQVSITVSAATSNSGTITLGSNTGSKVFVGAVTNTGTWTSTAITSGNLIFRGGIASNGGSFNAGGATFNTNAQSLTGSVAMAFTDIVATGIAVTNSNTNATSGVTISNSLTGNGTWTQGTTNNILTFGGATVGVTNFTANTAGNTVNYNASGAQAIRDVPYTNLTTSGSGTKTWTLTAGRTVGGILTVGSGTTLAAVNNQTIGITGATNITGTINLGGTSTKTFTGLVTINAGGVWDLSGAVQPTSFAGGITMNGTTFNNGTGAATFTATQSLSGSSAMTFGGSVTISGATTVLTNSNTSTVTLSNTGAAQLTGTAGAIWRQGANSTLNYAGSTITTITLDATTNTPNLVDYNGDVAQTISTVNYSNLTIEIPATATASRTKSLGGNVTVQGNFTAQSLHASNTVTLNPGGNDFQVNGTTTLNARGQFLDATNSGTNTFGGAVTIATNGLLSSGANSNIVFQSDITNSGTLTLTTTGTLSFTGAGNKTISGSGTYTLTPSNLTLNSTGAANTIFNMSANMTISGNIAFSANGLLVLGSSANLIFTGSPANLTGYNSSRYIQVDGTSSTNSNFSITTTAASGAQWQTTYPIGTSAGGYTPINLPTVNNPAPPSNSTLSVKAIVTQDVDGRLKRTFRITVAGNTNATTFSGGIFTYIANLPTYTDVSVTDVESDYTTAWRYDGTSWTTVPSTVNSGGTHTIVVTGGTAATASLTTGTYFYTCGSTISSAKSWYSYQTGNYSDFNTWTLDPSGTTFDNPQTLYPSIGDDITILNGFTVTVDLSGQSLVATQINAGGTLDMGTTTSQTLGTITGTGLLRINGVNLPTGTYTDFVSTLGGTIEYYDTGGNLPTTGPTATPTYNKLKFTNSTASNITYVLVSNLVVNGTFDLSTTGAGTVGWQINDASNSQRTITLNGDLTVASGGRITVGTGNEGSLAIETAGNPEHQLIMYGNITNNGIIQFYDATDSELLAADYGKTYDPINGVGVDLHRNELQGNAVKVIFSSTSNQTVTCNNTTDFYRITVDKGSAQQYILTINSANTAFFRLFGPANIPTSETTPSTNSWEWFSANAVSLLNGTLQLTGNINIPCLQLNLTSTTGYFPIPRNAALWLNGANVAVQVSDLTPDVFAGNKDGRILISGLLRISSGTLTDGFAKGIGSQDGGSYLQEGGTVNCWQFRPRVGGSNIFSFNQTGGTLNVGYGYALSGGKIDTYEEDYSRFDLNNANSTFQMSGSAILNVAKPTNNNGGDGGLFRLGSSAANYNVTGGTINLYTGAEAAGRDYPGYINTTVPLYNVNIYEEAATTQEPQLQTNSLIVLNSLTLNTGNTPSFITNNLNVTVGGDFIINSGTTYTPGTGTTTFNGSGAQAWTNNGTITSLASVVMNKSAGTLTLGGSTPAPTFPNITTALTLTSGTLNDGGNTVVVSGTGILTNNATHTGTGAISYQSTAATIFGTGGTFGNLTITTNATVATAGGQTVTGTLRLVSANTTLNIGANALTVTGNIYANASPGTAGLITDFTATKRIITNGFHNAGGLTRQGAAGDLLFPVGTGTLYTPNIINVALSSGSHGLITVRPVASEHPNVTTTSKSLQYYWRVTSSGAYTSAVISSVAHKSYTFSTATKGGTAGELTSYRSARFDPVGLTWATNNTTYNGTGTTVIPDFNANTSLWTGLTGGSIDKLDGEYTCGNVTAFGNVTTYYSKASGVWNATAGAAVWTDSPTHTGGTNLAGPPCATCPVVIGDGASINHTITIDANSRSCGTMAINTGSTLDCGTFNSLNFGTNTGGAVTGRGTLRIGTPNFPAGDFTNFIGASGGTVEYYVTTATVYSLTGSLTGAGGSTLAGMTAGTYTNVAASSTSGSGTNARFTVVVGNATTITSVTVTTPGLSYANGNTVTFNGSLFGGSGSQAWNIGAANIGFQVPAAGPTPQFLNLSTYYNLVLTPSTGFDINMPVTDLTIYNNFTVSGASLTGRAVTNVVFARTISIGGGLNVTGGTLSLANNTAATSTSISITGNTVISSGAAITIQTTNAATHTITTTGSITNNGGLDLYGGATTRVANLIFTGTNNVNLDGTNGLGADFSFITVNKGTSQTPTVNFSMGGTKTATNNNPTPWLTLTNGTFDFNNSGSFDLINVAAGAVNFTIPSTAKLKVSAGTVNVLTDNVDGADLILNGTLEVAGGAVVIGDLNNDNNNDIEYASAGSPTITVSSGSLYVNGSIRRSTSTITGALVYNQTGGTVTVGGRNSDANNTRGVFEIDANAGSSFTLTNSASLIVERQTGGTSYQDLYINPVTSNVSSTSTIYVGANSTTNLAQANFRIYITPTIGNFVIRNGDGNDAQVVNMSNALVCGGSLTINTPSTLNTNSLNVTIGGDFTANGTATYSAGTNTTTFNGSGAQAATLTSNTDFYDVTVNKSAGTLTLSGTAPTAPALNNLNILSGTLDVGAIALTVNRNITIDGAQTNTGGGSVVVYSTSGISNSITSSSTGSFTNLTLGGTATSRTINVTGDMTINGTLTFSIANRYLNIGSYQLTFGPSAPLVVGAGASDFILTNGVSSDLGVVKNWSSSGTFVYQVGGGLTTNYTPVSFSLNVTTAGTLGVIPVNSAHPTSNATGEQLLNYYWTVTRGNTLAATVTANHTYTYASTLIVGTGGSLVAGYLDVNNPVGWTTSGHGGSATTTQMDFTNAVATNIPSAGFSYDYAVGTTNTLPNPIVPLYSRLSTANVTNGTGGNWNVANSWTTDSDGDLDNNNPSAVAPVGVPVVILSGARINTNLNGRKAFKTTINGLLNNGTRTGHNFGIISGTGTFRTTTNTFPAGNYTAFVSAGGGTIEYAAAITMNSRSTYNNLSIESSVVGTVTMANTNLVLNGNLTVPAGATLNNPSNNSMSIAGNWNNSGTITFGTGAVTFTGTNAQSITGTNTFNSLTLNKASQNVTLSGTGTTVVTSGLTLTSGNLISSSTNTLALGSATLSGGSSSSYIVGRFTKTVGASTTFNIPVGSITPSRYRPATIANTSGADDWSFEYVGSSPSSGGYSSKSFNSSNIGTVSGFEYWLISRAGSTSADVTLSYGSGSYIPPNVGTVANLRVVHWDATALPSARWDLPSGGGTQSQSGTNLAGTVTVTNVTSFSPVTVGSTDTNSPLPVTLISFTGKLVDGGVQLKWKTLTEINSAYFEIEKSATGEQFTSIHKQKGAGTSTKPNSYDYLDQDVWSGKTYYRLKQVDFSGEFEYLGIISVDYSENGKLLLSLYPNPASGKTVTLAVSGIKNLDQLPVTVTDQIGHNVMSGKVEITDGSGEASISIEDLPNGIYFVKVGNSNQLIKRIVVAH